LTPSASDQDEPDEDVSMPDLTDGDEEQPGKTSQAVAPASSRRQSSRGTKRRAVNYVEADADD